jgi:hypothetical protein
VGQPITEIRDRQHPLEVVSRGLRFPDHPIAFFLARMGTRVTALVSRNGLAATAGGGAAMTDRSYEIPQDADLRSLVRVVSACTLGLWAFAAGLLIGVFLFS